MYFRLLSHPHAYGVYLEIVFAIFALDFIYKRWIIAWLNFRNNVGIIFSTLLQTSMNHSKEFIPELYFDSSGTSWSLKRWLQKVYILFNERILVPVFGKEDLHNSNIHFLKIRYNCLCRTRNLKLCRARNLKLKDW